MEDDVLRGGLGPHDREQVTGADAFPSVVVARPGGDAVDVGHKPRPGQVRELAPLPGHGILDLTVDEQPPGMVRYLGLDAEVEHRPGLDAALARRQALATWRQLAGEQATLLCPLALAVDKLLLELAKQRDVVVRHEPLRCCALPSPNMARAVCV